MNIYAFSLPSMEGILKIGQTTGNIKKRIKQQCSFLFEEPVIEYERYDVNISDHEVRNYLISSGFERVRNEWMAVTVEDVEKAVSDLVITSCKPHKVVYEPKKLKLHNTSDWLHRCIGEYVPAKKFSKDSLQYKSIPLYELYYCLDSLYGKYPVFELYDYVDKTVLQEICNWFVTKYNCADLIPIIKELCWSLHKYRLLGECDSDVFNYYKVIKEAVSLYKLADCSNIVL